MLKIKMPTACGLLRQTSVSQCCACLPTVILNWVITLVWYLTMVWGTWYQPSAAVQTMSQRIKIKQHILLTIHCCQSQKSMPTTLD